MDWTGGARRRFAAGKNSATVQKQKQFFARMRSTFDHSPRSQIQFLPDYLHSANAQVLDTSRSVTEHPRKGPGTAHTRLPSMGRGHLNYTSRTLKKTEAISSPSSHPQTISRQDQIARPRRDDSVVSASSHNATSIITTPRIRNASHEQKATSSSAPKQGTKRKAEDDVPELKQQSSKADEIHATFPRPATQMTEEERLLMHRRSLLARKDWLGLNVARPLQIDFPSSHDKDKVGKRRKVKLSHRAKPAGHRLLTPLFEERLQQPDYIMSGALPDDVIQVKVGTEALASQTQPSHRSHTPANTSMRPPSTEFGPLSEESMLLGADGDIFEAHRHAERNTSQQYQLGESMATPPEKDSRQSTRPRPDTAEMRSVTEDGMTTFEGDGGIRDDVGKDMNGFEADYQKEPSSSPSPTHCYYVGQQPVAGARDDVPHMKSEPHIARFPRLFGEAMKPSNANEITAEAEQSWRNFVNVPKYSSSHTSVAALKSSSQHLTTSDSSRRPPLRQIEFDDGETLVSTPKGAGTEKALLTQPMNNASCSESHDLMSPSQSLKQIMTLANEPTRAAGDGRRHDVEDEAGWRDFLIGSSDGESECHSQAARPTTKCSDEITDEGSTNMVPRSDLVSSLGMSVDAIAGTTLFVTGSTSSAQGAQGATPARQAAIVAKNVRRHYTARDPLQAHHSPRDKNSIEEASSPLTRHKKPTNIHTGAARPLDPWRFKRAPSKRSASKRKATGPDDISRSKRKKTMAATRDIYDLVDSGGVSLA